MESIISTFHIDWKIIIAQAVNFGVVFVVLYIFALKPLSKLMQERAEKIAKGLTDAKTNEAMLASTKAEYDEMLAKARVEADKIFQAGKKEGEKKKAELLEETKSQTDVIVANGKKALEAEKVKMVQEARTQIVDIAMLAAEKITGAASASFDKKVVEDLKKM